MCAVSKDQNPLTRTFFTRCILEDGFNYQSISVTLNEAEYSMVFVCCYRFYLTFETPIVEHYIPLLNLRCLVANRVLRK